MKILLFCTPREKSALIDAFSLSYEKHTVMTTAGPDLAAVLEAFNREERAILIMQIKLAITGFRVPKDTLILFSRNCPEGPLRVQAAARALIGV